MNAMIEQAVNYLRGKVAQYEEAIRILAGLEEPGPVAPGPLMAPAFVGLGPGEPAPVAAPALNAKAQRGRDAKKGKGGGRAALARAGKGPGRPGALSERVL